MAAFKYSLKLGQRAPDAVLSAGTAIAGSEALELNVDVTKMSRLQAYELLRHFARKIVKEGAWPPLGGTIPANALLGEDGNPILNEDGTYQLTE